MKKMFVKVMVVCMMSSSVGCAGGYKYTKEEMNEEVSVVETQEEEDILLSRVPNPETFFVDAKEVVYYGSAEAGIKGVQVLFESSEKLHDKWKLYIDACNEVGVWTINEFEFDENWSHSTEDGKYKLTISCLEDSNMIDIFVTVSRD